MSKKYNYQTLLPKNNWPGVIENNGYELAKQMHEHAKSYGTQIDEGIEVQEIKQNGKTHTVIAKDAVGKEKIYETKSIIIASGIHPRELGIEGEDKFRGKGVTYCTVCDGPLFKGKTTATIGSGNSALESALMMAGIAEKVYLVTKYANDEKIKGGFPKGEDILIKKIKELKNVEIIHNADTKEILGDQFVEGIQYEDV